MAKYYSISFSGVLPCLGIPYRIVALSDSQIVIYNFATRKFVTCKLELSYRSEYYFYYQHKRFYLLDEVFRCDLVSSVF